MPRRLAKTAARGYGSRHQAFRKEWAPLVDAGHVTCWRCGQPIAPGQAWDLGHDDHDRSIYTGPEHTSCNRATAGRHPRRRRTPTPTSGIRQPPTAARW